METYYSPESFGKNYSADGIGRFNPKMWEAFTGYFGAVYQDAALTAREKALVALGCAAALQCPYCIDAYTNTCLQQGCDEAEIAEAFHVTNAIRGGAALAHGVQALKIIQEQEL